MKSIKGFTLIELIIVIIILGVLAAVAIPKYIDLKTQSNNAVASGVLNAMMGADSILFAKYVLNGIPYDESSIISNVNQSGVTDLTIVGNVGTITVDSMTHTFTYMAHGTNTAGQFIKNW